MSKKVLLHNVFSIGVIQIVNFIFPLITVPLVSRIIGPEKFGVINFASAFIAYFISFINYGFDVTATRKIAQRPQDRELRNQVFSETLFSQCLLLLISIAIFCVCLYFVPELRAERRVAVYTFVVCFGTVITQNWLFQAMQDLPKIAILNFISKVLFTGLIICTIHHRSDYVWQPLAVSASTIVVGIVSFTWSVRKYQLSLQRISIRACLRNLKNEMPYFASVVVITLYTTTNTVLLGLFRNPEEVGFYTAGQKLVTIFQSILSVTLLQSLYPYVGKAFGESREKGIDLAQRLLPLVLFFTAGAGLLFFVFGPFALLLFYGNAFEPSIPVFRILAFSPVIICFSTVVAIHVMLNLKMDRLFLKVTIAGAVFSVLSNFLWVPRFGFIASAYNLLLTELLVALLFYISLRRQGINLINRKYFRMENLTKSILSIRK